MFGLFLCFLKERKTATKRRKTATKRRKKKNVFFGIPMNPLLKEMGFVRPSQFNPISVAHVAGQPALLRLCIMGVVSSPAFGKTPAPALHVKLFGAVCHPSEPLPTRTSNKCEIFDGVCFEMRSVKTKHRDKQY